jgi:phosphohistidine swiveling domain-containing protein
MKRTYLYALSDSSIRERGGKKAENLRFLIKHHFNVPEGWVVSWDAYADYLRDGASVLRQLRQEIEHTLPIDRSYAVRSSASIEDDQDFSYAGMFVSELQVNGVDNLMQSILNVWHSMDLEAFVAYHRNQPEREPSVRLAVILQTMVKAACSGVGFSKNPMTGLSETILEAGQGTGEDQVATQQDPQRWVEKWGNWISVPEEGLLDQSVAHTLVQRIKSMAQVYGQPVDVEWAYDGTDLFFLQVRPITQLDIPVFSNRISREMLPGIIKPLVWSINTRLINREWTNILTQLTGDTSFDPDALTGHFFYRAYFNMSVFGRVFERMGMPYEALELLFGLESDGPDKPHMRPGSGFLKRIPNVLGFLISIARIEHHLTKLLSQKSKQYARLIETMKPNLSLNEWLDVVEALIDETTSVARMNIMIPMLAMMHHRMLTHLLSKHGIDTRALVLEGVDDAHNRYSPHQRLEKLRQQYPILPPEDPLTQQQFENDFDQFLKDFGHFSDSGNDFSQTPWRETPQLIRSMLSLPPHQKPQTSPALRFADLRLPRSQRFMIRWFYRRTSRFAVHREAISSMYTYGYGQFRPCFLAIGATLCEQDRLNQPDDVFYLYWSELVEVVRHKQPLDLRQRVNQRQRDIEAVRDANVPDLIFGHETPPLTSESLPTLHGVPTSLGYYTGPARVIQGLSDFDRLEVGDVLIIPYSDVGWTPLFSKAGAVIAESGGILSHSSIVAREYHIPAVVSVRGACRIPDGTLLAVNGYTGAIERKAVDVPSEFVNQGVIPLEATHE